MASNEDGEVDTKWVAGMSAAHPEQKGEEEGAARSSSIRPPPRGRPAGFAFVASNEDGEVDTKWVAGMSAAHPEQKGEEEGAAGSSSIRPPPGLAPPPSSPARSLAALPPDALQLFVISLDNEDGKQRRAKMNLFQFPKYELSDGVAPGGVPQHVRDHWYYGRMSTSRNRALQGAFAAHWKVWMRIAAGGDKGALVLEDDSVQYRLFPQLAKYERDGITLLGGCFKGYSTWGV